MVQTQKYAKEASLDSLILVTADDAIAFNLLGKMQDTHTH